MDTPNIAGKMPVVCEMSPGTYWWCACGLSKNQPFCDGSHRTTPFTPIEVVIEEPRKVAWCVCKHSQKKPYCDGTHRKL